MSAESGPISMTNMPPLPARDGDRQRKTLRQVLVERADLDTLFDIRTLIAHRGVQRASSGWTK
jgi:hypothetical protein